MGFWKEEGKPFLRDYSFAIGTGCVVGGVSLFKDTNPWALIILGALFIIVFAVFK